MVDRNRVAKEVRAVAKDGDHQTVGRRQLGAERGAASPAETRSGARTKIAARAVRPAMLRHQGVFVDEDRILRLDARDAGAGPSHVDRAQARGAFAELLPSGDKLLALLSQATTPF